MPILQFYPLNWEQEPPYKYAVIVSRFQGKWVYCQHKERITWEIPGGKREPGETILETARRELYEETGAAVFDLTPVCTYTAQIEALTYGLLCFAEIKEIGTLPKSEIRRIALFEQEPAPLTYPQMHPAMLKTVLNFLKKFH